MGAGLILVPVRCADDARLAWREGVYVKRGAVENKVSVVSLGCPKNDSDTEVMLGILASHGYEFVSEPEEAQILLINTCAFIKPAVEESLGFLNEAIECKQRNPEIKIIVAGCLPQRWRLMGGDVPPEVDCVLGVGEYHRICDALEHVTGGKRVAWVGEADYLPTETTPRIRFTPAHYAYLKIADGCDNCCSYCLIPSLRGKYRSRTVEEILEEASAAAKGGAKEAILVGQDTTSFGRDRGRPGSLAELLRALSGIEGLEWIRVLYTYPAYFSDDLVGAFQDLPNVLPYVDVPLQHSHDDILERMNRYGRNPDIVRLIDMLRDKIKDVVIRSTFIVGFPGETEEHFKHLLDFLGKMCFDRVGIFAYCPEEGSAAARFPHQVPDRVRQARRDTAMNLQQGISLASNERLIGKTLRTLIDGELPDRPDIAVGRTYRDAPEIDGQIFVEGDSLRAGDMIDIEVTGAKEYDLIGRRVNET